MSPRTAEQNQVLREETRSSIRQAAFPLFARQGFTQTPVSAIAEEAGISKGLIYHYFDSKEAILESIFEELAAMSDQAMDFPDHLPPAGRFVYMIEMIFGFIREETETMRLLIGLSLQPEALRTLKPAIDRYNKQQMTILKELLEELGHDDAETEAYFLGAQLDGFAMGCISMGEEYPLETMKEKVIRRYVPDHTTS
ncbi:MAG: TetR/AcrR family transcriptional regulator [Balneolaceae bacterium]|nr:TetR/AcrR family transcriptional regulator [Balneolaceae bacterium]